MFRIQRMNRRLTDASLNVADQPSSSDECLVDSDNFSVRKKMRKRRRKHSPIDGAVGKKSLPTPIEAISDSPSDEIANVNDSDCSETFIQTAMLSRLHAAANEEATVLQSITDSHLIDLLSGAENDGSYSSPLSNKSEKNMGDFEDEDSPCEEELAQLSNTHCLSVSLKGLRARPLGIGESLPAKGVLSKAESVSSSTIKSSATSVSSITGCVLKPHSSGAGVPLTYRMTDVCKPGNTLLWDLLMDDKIVSITKNTIHLRIRQLTLVSTFKSGSTWRKSCTGS